MKPMGRETIKFPSKTDAHVKKYGEKNWWEDEHQPSKKRERQAVKRGMIAQMEELKND